MPSVVLENVSIKYKLKRKQYIDAVKNVSITFPNNKITSVIGESGSGKTSILRAISGFLDYEGDIKFDDVSTKGLPPNKKGISYVSQNIGLYPNMTVFNNIAFPLKLVTSDEEEIRKRVAEVAELLNIKNIISRKPKEISLGQAQRVAIARALVKKSLVYIFDEPFSNLDQPLSEQLTRELKEIFTKNKNTVIFVSHSAFESMYLADEVVVMHEGEVIESGSPEKIQKSKKQEVKELLAN